MRTAFFVLAGGVAGFLLGATGASIYAALTRMSRMEGGIGAFAAGIGMLTGLLGAVLSLLYLLRSRGAGTSALVVGTLLVLIGLAAALGVARWRYTRSQAYFTRKYGSVRMRFELVRRGGGSQPTERPAAQVLEDGESGEATWESLSDVPVLSGSVFLYRFATRRELVLRSPGEAPLAIPLELPRDPSHARQDWSAWTDHGQWSARYRVER